MMLSSQHRAFSLLELTVSLAIGTAMIGAFLFFYQVLINHREVVLDELNEDIALQSSMNQMAVELQSVVQDDYLNMSVEGEIDSIRILHSSLPDAQVWQDREATDDDSEFLSSDLRISTYQLRLEEDEDLGELVIAGLERKVQKIHTAETLLQDAVTLLSHDEDAEDLIERSSLISSNIQFLRFRYWNGENWSDNWSDQQPPVAIEVIMGRAAISETMDLETYLATYPVKLRLIHVRDRAGVDSPQVRGLGGSSR